MTTRDEAFAKLGQGHQLDDECKRIIAEEWGFKKVVRCKECIYCETNETWNCFKNKDETTWWCENPCFNTGDPFDCIIIKDHENGCMKGERKDGDQDGKVR